MERRCVIPGPAGLLEGVLTLPDGDGPHPAVVVCHPHPQYGGDLHSNVVLAACQGCFRLGVASLRFNFRGVGESAGIYDGGAGEQDDARAALAFLAEQADIDPGRLGLAGYSFGAQVAMAVADAAPEVRALAVVSPPMREPGSLLQGFDRPKLLLLGDRDRGIPAAALQAFAAGLPDPTKTEIVTGADHFWRGFEPFLAETAGAFFAGALRARIE